jgi:hypothetical protein
VKAAFLDSLIEFNEGGIFRRVRQPGAEKNHDFLASVDVIKGSSAYLKQEERR